MSNQAKLKSVAYKLFCAIVLGVGVAAAAHAGSFSLSPTRIEMTGNKRTAVITLTNADASPLTVQASVVSWTQALDGDLFADTRELLVTPPVFTVPPNGQQVVRIARRGAAADSKEIPYRVFFNEVPQPGKAEFNGLNIALRVGVPIFLLPTKATAPKLEWEVSPLPEGKLRIDAKNVGNRHIQVTDFDVDLGEAVDRAIVNVVRYVLPDQRVSWTITPPAGARYDAGSVRIRGSSDFGEFDSLAKVSVVP
jgi:fimbrial chaperone protein